MRLVLFLLLCCFSYSYAQIRSGTLTGTVTDPSGSVIPGATVKAGTQSSRTDAQGQYRISGLAPGAYAIHAEAPGFTAFDKSGFEIATGQEKSLDISLLLRTQSEQVTVAAEGAAALDTDPSNNAGALVMQKADLDALPDDPDDLTSDLQALAGPAAGPGGGQFFIDGFTGGRMPPKQSIREIRINQNPFAAQFDRPGQGRVEIFTKPGSEEFNGDVLFQFGDAAFNSRNPLVTTKPPYQRKQYEAEMGGPLGKKTSFYLDVERRDATNTSYINAVVLDSNFTPSPLMEALVRPASGTEADLRLDRQLSTNHTLTVRYGYSRDTDNSGGVGNFSLAERAYYALGREQTFQLLETGVLNQHTVNETRFRVRRQDSSQTGGTSAPVLNVMDAFTSGGSSVGNSFDNQTRYEIQNFTSWVHGVHTVKFGGLARVVTLDDQAMQNYAGTFTFTSLAAYRLTLLGMQQHLSAVDIRAMGGGASQFTLSAGNPLASLNQTDFGIFIQDDWRWRPNLTVSGGLRYEAQTHSGDRSDFGPRLGFAWAVGGKKGAPAKNVIRAGFGMFYDRLSESLTLEALRQNGVRQQQFLIPNPDFYPSVPAAASLSASVQPQTIRETSAQWRAPALVQAGIGFERQLPKHITVSTNYLHTGGFHALRSRNINAPVPGAGALPYGGVNAIYLYETSGVYRQNQFITNVNARVSAKLTFSGSYIFGTAVSNTDGAGSFPSNQYDLSGETGPAPFNTRHRLQMNGSWYPRWGLRFSPFLTVTSGRPYNIITGRDLNGDGLFTDRPGIASDASIPGVRVTAYGLLDPNPRPGGAILPRNFGTGPGSIGANMRVSKAFNVGEHAAGKDSTRQIVVSANARNFLNHPNFATPNGNLSSPVFGQSTSLTAGGGGGGGSVPGVRRIDLQIRFNF